jgi:hypothetical protein
MLAIEAAVITYTAAILLFHRHFPGGESVFQAQLKYDFSMPSSIERNKFKTILNLIFDVLTTLTKYARFPSIYHIKRRHAPLPPTLLSDSSMPILHKAYIFFYRSTPSICMHAFHRNVYSNAAFSSAHRKRKYQLQLTSRGLQGRRQWHDS